jgi:phosphate transport system substrate-binding protein
MSRSVFSALAIGAALLSFIGQAAATELKVSGAATVAGSIIVPNKAAIEQDIGATLAITVNGDGNGLRDLCAGKSDIMMVAAPIAVTAATLNKATPGSVSVDDVQVARIGTASIKFIVNPGNPIKSLTDAQVKDILTGKITSWKDVGGADQPIVVVAEAPGLGTRANIVSSFLAGADISDKARLMQALVQVAQVVAQLPNALGYGNNASITDAVAVLPGLDVAQPLGLATKGPPGAEAKKLIDIATKYGASVK